MDKTTTPSACPSCAGRGVVPNPVHLRRQGISNYGPARGTTANGHAPGVDDIFLLELPCTDEYHSAEDPLHELLERALGELEKVHKLMSEHSIDPANETGLATLVKALDPLSLARACIDNAISRSGALVQIAEAKARDGARRP